MDYSITYTSPLLSSLQFLLDLLNRRRLLGRVGAAGHGHAHGLRQDHLVRQTSLRHLLAADFSGYGKLSLGKNLLIKTSLISRIKKIKVQRNLSSPIDLRLIEKIRENESILIQYLQILVLDITFTIKNYSISRLQTNTTK